MKNVNEQITIKELEIYIRELMYLTSEKPPLSYESKKVIVTQINAVLDSHALLNGIRREPFPIYEKDDVAYRLNQMLYLLETRPELYLGEEPLTKPARKYLIKELKKTVDMIRQGS